MSDLDIWVVCRNPADYPGKFTLRRHSITAGQSRPTADLIVSDRLITLRRIVIGKGLFRMPRQQGDDPVILESWI